MDPRGKVAIVTGGAAGIGLAFTKALLQQGAKVLIADVDVAGGQKVASSLQAEFGAGNVAFSKTDVTSEDSFDQAFRTAKKTFKRLDIVVNNAGIMRDNQWDKQEDINVKGVILGTLLGFKHMGKEGGGPGGIVVNVASVAGLNLMPPLPLYCATKAAVITFSRGYGHPVHVERTGVTVTALCPGATNTQLLHGVGDFFLHDNVGAEWKKLMDNWYINQSLASFLFLWTLLVHASGQDAAGAKPHIIFIMADDLGFNDLSFRGSNQIPTPNIDSLAYSGVVLDRYYVTPLCTPSRSALMTGKYPEHTGMQHLVLYAAEPRGLPLTEKLLPEYLRELGYRTHAVGKWHLGHYKREYTPTYRGFESHLGYWAGHHDLNDHSLYEFYLGLDMRRGLEAAWDLHGSYSTDLFTSEAVNIISSHNASEPLFLYVAHAAVHTGNWYNLLTAPDEVVAKFDYIQDYYRRRLAAMVSKLDDSVGEIVGALSTAGMLSNSVIIFSTDNGGGGELIDSAGSNWPLRGLKNTIWEGGVRGAGVMWSPLLSSRKKVFSQLMHITDWLPTLHYLAGGDPTDLGDIDGVNMWDALSNDGASNRTQVLVNIDNIDGFASVVNGEWKLVKGTNHNGEWDGWYGDYGFDNGSVVYDMDQILNSTVGQALAREGYLATASEALAIRDEAKVSCNVTETITCSPLEAPCLFRITEDPCEMQNLADRYPEILQEMEDLLAQINATTVPASNVDLDPRADPVYWDHTWTNFGDYLNLD